MRPFLTIFLLAMPATLVGQTLPPTAAPPSDFAYPLTAEAGPWLVFVQAFKGEKAQMQAEELAEYLRREYRLPAYLRVIGREAKAAEEKRVAELRKQYADFIKSMEAQAKPDAENQIDRTFRVRTQKIEEEFAVLVGAKKPLKEIDDARSFLDDLRKMKPLPAKFSNTALLADANGEVDKTGKLQFATINPFQTAFVVRNAFLPLQKPDDKNKPDPFLKELNANEPMSLLKTTKPYTLMVRMYQGTPVVQQQGDTGVLGKLGFGKKPGEALNSGAMQAQQVAKLLRAMKEKAFETYVLHMRHASYVCVGEFDKPDDPRLQAASKALAGMQLKVETGVVIDTLLAEPRVMKIPRP